MHTPFTGLVILVAPLILISNITAQVIFVIYLLFALHIGVGEVHNMIVMSMNVMMMMMVDDSTMMIMMMVKMTAQ